MKFREIEKLLLTDGWKFKSVKGSHYQYVHPVKPGKVTIPFHPGFPEIVTMEPENTQKTL
jgi:predicted RNA binding protein YcfA (HicA-like mRNA interferase family)